MKLLKSPNGWSCLAASFAMVLDLTVEEIFEKVGHDGSEEWWPALDPPFDRRSFHIQEMISVAYNLGYLCTPIEAVPFSVPIKGGDPKCIQFKPIDRYKKHNGILIGKTLSFMPHAVAWDGKYIYDPRGYVLNQNDFYVQVFWIVTKSPTPL